MKLNASKKYDFIIITGLKLERISLAKLSTSPYSETREQLVY